VWKVRKEDQEEGKEGQEEEEVTRSTWTLLPWRFSMVAKKKSKKAGKAAKKKSYYLGKEIRACRSR